MRPTLDHVFVFVPADGRAPAAAAAMGLRRTHARVHRGQGTANACYGFDDAFLELLWRHDATELGSPAVARTGLEPRSRWVETGACPFGLCFRTARAPVPTWEYTVPFPPGMSVEMAETSTDPAQPVLFFVRDRGAPTPAGRQPLGATMRATRLQMLGDPAPEIRALLEAAGVALAHGAPRLDLAVGGASEVGVRNLPGTPVWLTLHP
jgi:hypothetical protein